MPRETVAVIGAGATAAALAHTLRGQGFGGRIVLVGQEDVAPYDRPELSKSVLVGETVAEPTWVLPPSFYAEQDVDLVLSTEVTEIRREHGRLGLWCGASELVQAENVVLATGADPRRVTELPPGPRVRYLRSWADALAMRAALRGAGRVLVVGSGFIGAEVAVAAAALGGRVELVEMADELMPGVRADEVRRRLVASLAATGVRCRAGARVQKAREGADGVEVVFDDEMVDRFDVVVVGAGACPNDGLGRRLGAVGRDGISVDGHHQTSVPGLYAGGDVASRPSRFGRVRHEHWRTAQHDGVAIARRILGHDAEPREAPWFWSDQGQQRLEVIGSPREGTAQAVRELGPGSVAVFHLSGPTLVGATLLNAPRLTREVRSVLGRSVAANLLTDPSVRLSAALATSTPAPSVPRTW